MNPNRCNFAILVLFSGVFCGCGTAVDSGDVAQEPSVSARASAPAPSAASAKPLVCETTLPHVESVYRPRISATDEYCDLRCAEGFANCDGDLGNGCESDLSTPEACGRCTDACLFELCTDTPSCRDLTPDETDRGPAIPNDAQGGLLAGDSDGTVFISVATAAWDVPAELLVKPGVALQLANAEHKYVWSSENNTQPARAIAVSRDFVYVCTSSAPDSASHYATLYQVTKAGKLLWERELEGTDCLDIHVDADQNVYLYGSRRDELTIEGLTLDEPTLIGHQVLSVSKSNKIQWLTDTTSDAIAASGNQVISLGFGLEQYDFETGEADKPDVFLDSGSIETPQMLLDPDGSLLIAGTKSDSSQDSRYAADPDLGAAVAVALPNGRELTATSHVGVLVRLNADQSLRWQTTFGSTQIRFVPHGVVVAPAGEIYVAVTDIPPGASEARSYLLRFSADGLQQGVVRFPETVTTWGFGQSLVSDVEAYIGFANDGPSPLLDSANIDRRYTYYASLLSFPDLPSKPLQN